MPPSQDTAERVPIVSLTAVLAPGGLAVKITSKVFEDFFRGLSTPVRHRESRDLYGGARYYDFETRFDDFTSGEVHNWGDRQLLINGKPNISMLRAVGITDGLDLTIQTVLNKRQMAEFLQAFEAAAIEFYAQYIRPERYELIITSQHVSERD